MTERPWTNIDLESFYIKDDYNQTKTHFNVDVQQY